MKTNKSSWWNERENELKKALISPIYATEDESIMMLKMCKQQRDKEITFLEKSLAKKHNDDLKEILDLIHYPKDIDDIDKIKEKIKEMIK